jgi:lipopolysaccharide/colanic/teichoic acid biosynthesis glycosyltransferase/GGDEF domain-containing protein
MKIFSREHNSYRLNGPLPIDPETGLYSQNFFLLRLKEERERTKRNGSAFSLLIVDVDGISTALNDKSRGSARTHQKKLVERLVRQSRKTDTKGWFDLKRVSILMPDTKNSGAIEFKQKIYRQIRQDWPSAEKVNLEKFIRVSTFPESSSDGNGSTLNQDNRGGDRNNIQDNAVYADILSPNLVSFLKRLVKRMLDVAAVVLGIILTFPLMLIIAVSIKLTCPGPVLFRQERIGLLGRRFTFLKFRSMTVDADQSVHETYVTNLINGEHYKINRGTEVQPIYKMNDDPRITSFGLILRKTSLDELPQLFNILRGHMSLVGPRPPIPYEVGKYKLWHSGRVFEVKPGLTGLWQVSGRNQMSFDDMVRLDLQYADNSSIWLDIKIIFKTFRAVLSAEGAY